MLSIEWRRGIITLIPKMNKAIFCEELDAVYSSQFGLQITSKRLSGQNRMVDFILKNSYWWWSNRLYQMTFYML